MTAQSPAPAQRPAIHTVGIDGLLVSFGTRLSEPANRAALAFRAALESAAPDGVEEVSTSLVSAYLRFDPLAVDHDALRAAVADLLAQQDWYDAALPGGRRLWRVPTAFGGEAGPQLDEAADLAGLSPAEALRELSQTRVRVQTIGFAPGQPYLGVLPDRWDIPRQSKLTERVPVGALTVAVRQLVLFSVSTPTGWRQVGRTALRLFRPDSDTPFLLRPGDEVLFDPVGAEALPRLEAEGPDGGAVAEPLR